ncbi:hypothetical protein Bca52824_064690 [Brassica carinata]|uniref:Uncharacterized protein n=1 Tax=Brassica carinata TaxID=52824 RepID=A0A8X7U8E3_BRACI|nr:hypothetical protein Bca52824_064690 [Brassica carinata]
MSRRLFLHIVDAIKQHDNYFNQQRDASGRLGLSTLQNVTAALRILAYGMPADATDEYIKIGKSTAIECMKRFCRAIVSVFSEWVKYVMSFSDLKYPNPIRTQYRPEKLQVF